MALLALGYFLPIPSVHHQHPNRTLANVYAPVADAVGYTNADVPPSAIPLLNLSGTTLGPLNPNASLFAPYPLPNTSAVGAGGGPVFVSP
jgi:hypothetical protein